LIKNHIEIMTDGENDLWINTSTVQVVVGVGDPNPLVGGAGVKTLEAAGITVEMIGGAEEVAAYDLNADFMKRMKEQGS
jgi:diaminohydroxyphosphoribosylaminopyrimidine deaminase/5-amino-6-(5-phosphoribosylamino)uracil reductase